MPAVPLAPARPACRGRPRLGRDPLRRRAQRHPVDGPGRSAPSGCSTPTSGRGSSASLESVVHEVLAPYGVTAEVSIQKGVPPVVNDAGCIAGDDRGRLRGRGARRTDPAVPRRGGLRLVPHPRPGAMARLGTRTPGGPTFDLHRGDLVVDEAAISVGARTLAGVAVAAARGLGGSARRVRLKDRGPGRTIQPCPRSRIGNTSCRKSASGSGCTDAPTTVRVHLGRCRRRPDES